jgi:flavin reductase (DIM6/NTAB) family NADH-FMN oxidoreductase RutF
MSIAADFKDALASWASGVSIVSTRAGGLVYGLTVSSFASLSMEPPLVLVCIGNKNRLPTMIRESSAFAISLLAKDQGDASAALARSGREPGADLDVPADECGNGLPVVKGAVAHLACELHSELVVGDHTIVVGRVVEAVASPDREPLLYYRRRYRTLEAGGTR